MSVSLYDAAVVNKIKSWVIDPNMTVLSPDDTAQLFKQTADQKDDKPIRLPLIAISRDRDIDINVTARRPQSFAGRTFNAGNGKADHLNGIPITIKYQLDVYCRFRHESDEYLRNFVYNLINYPELEIEIPYQQCQLGQKAFMEIQPTVSDNSDIPERLNFGQFTRITIRFNLTDALLFSYKVKDIAKVIKAGIYVNQDLEPTTHYSGDNCELDFEVLAESNNKNN